MIRTVVTLLVVVAIVCAVYGSLQALYPQFPQPNVGLLGVMIGLIAGAILRQR